MVLPVAFLIGFAFGWQRAARRGGRLPDCLQYGAAHGIAALLVTLVVAVILDRSGVL